MDIFEEVGAVLEQIEEAEEAALVEFSEAEIEANMKNTRYIPKNFWDCLD